MNSRFIIILNDINDSYRKSFEKKNYKKILYIPNRITIPREIRKGEIFNMKRKIISICLIGMFLTIGIFATPAEKTYVTSQEIENAFEMASLFSSNTVSIGEVYTVYEPEVLTGCSNAEVINMSTSWVVNPGDEFTHGVLGMEIFDYNYQNENPMGFMLSPFAKTTVCDYEFIVYDGPTSSARRLSSGFSSLMGDGVKYERMDHPFSVRTQNQPRTLAFELNAKTQTYIPALRMTLETETGSVSKIGHMIIDFITPAEKLQELESSIEETTAATVNTIDINLGKILIYTSDSPTNIPKRDLVTNSYPDPFPVNQSEIITVNAHLDYELSITEKVHPQFFNFLNCKILINIKANAHDSSQRYRQIPFSGREFDRLLIFAPILEDGTLSTSFTVDTSLFPTGCDFVISYFLIVPGLFGSQVWGGSDRSAETGKVNIRWIPN